MWLTHIESSRWCRMETGPFFQSTLRIEQMRICQVKWLNCLEAVGSQRLFSRALIDSKVMAQQSKTTKKMDALAAVDFLSLEQLCRHKTKRWQSLTAALTWQLGVQLKWISSICRHHRGFPHITPWIYQIPSQKSPSWTAPANTVAFHQSSIIVVIVTRVISQITKEGKRRKTRSSTIITVNIVILLTVGMAQHSGRETSWWSKSLRSSRKVRGGEGVSCGQTPRISRHQRLRIIIRQVWEMRVEQALMLRLVASNRYSEMAKGRGLHRSPLSSNTSRMRFSLDSNIWMGWAEQTRKWAPARI